MRASQSTINIVSSTITNNISTGGMSTGGVYVLAGSTVNVQNSIIAGNSAGLEDPDVRGAFTSGGYNLIGDVGAASGFTQPTDLVGPVLPLRSLGGSTPLDPKLGPLAPNGGPTMSHRPMATSPGIDKGNSFGSITDQRGFARIFDFPGIANTGDGADIGAFEHLGPTAAAVSVSGNVRTANGFPIRNASVTIFGGDLSEPLTVATGSFGSFSFDGLRAGQTYFVMVSAGRHSFAEPVRTVVTVDDVDDLDFVSN